MKQVPQSFRILRNLVHFSVELQNDGSVPAFVPPGDAKTFAHVWDGLRPGGDAADAAAQAGARKLEEDGDTEERDLATGASTATLRWDLPASCPTPAAHCGAAAVAVYAKSEHRRLLARSCARCEDVEERIAEHEEKDQEEIEEQ